MISRKKCAPTHRCSYHNKYEPRFVVLCPVVHTDDTSSREIAGLALGSFCRPQGWLEKYDRFMGDPIGMSDHALSNWEEYDEVWRNRTLSPTWDPEYWLANLEPCSYS